MSAEFVNQFKEQVALLAQRLNEQEKMLSVAESCTGGWLAKVCTDREGSSHWFERGFVTYTNEAKQELLGVAAQTLASNGAVSELTAAEMAQGALHNSRAQISVAITGIAGPGGGSEAKPVGTVCFGWAVAGQKASSEQCHFEGDRESVRAQAVLHALKGLNERLE